MPAIEPVTLELIPSTKKDFCGFSLGSNQYWSGRAYALVYFMTAAPKGSTESGLSEYQGIESETPCLQGKNFLWLIHG